MTEEVKNLLQSIATQLGVTIDHVTQAYCRYRVFDSLRYFILWVILTLISIYLLQKALYFFKMGSDAAEEKYGIDSYDYDPTKWFFLIATIVLFIIFLVGAFLNTGWVTWLFAPEGAFYNEIITSLKGL